MLHLLPFALACSPDQRETDPVDTGTGNQPPEDTYVFTCDSPDIVETGPTDPHVGDEWTMFIWCGDVLIEGVMVLTFQPAEFAAVHANTATFLQSGTASMHVQAGRIEADEDVTVAE